MFNRVKVSHFFALIANKHKKEQSEVFNLYASLCRQPCFQTALVSGSKDEIMRLASDHSIELDESTYRRIRGLALAQLTEDEVNLVTSNSRNDIEASFESLNAFISNSSDPSSSTISESFADSTPVSLMSSSDNG